MPDERTLRQKMLDVANAESAAPGERAFAKEWLRSHKAEPDEELGRPRFRSSRFTTSRSTASTSTTTPLDADAFEEVMRSAFYEGFAEEMGKSPFFSAPSPQEAKEHKAARQRVWDDAQAELRRLKKAREASQRAYAKYLKEKKDAERAASFDAKAAGVKKDKHGTYIIAYDENGDPIRRRQW
jgi:hypothetical protein